MHNPYAGAWETRYSARGHPFQVWQPTMPWIDPQFSECAVYLYPSEADAEDGNQIGGSGFLVGIPVSPPDHPSGKMVIICVVTNRHVADAGHKVLRLNTRDGGTDVIALDGVRWFSHPQGDDLSVCPIRLVPSSHKYRFVTPSNFITQKAIDTWDIGPGDDVFVVGRFVNHEGKQRNNPSLRFGNIAQMNHEPIMMDGYPQESFLVEARSIAGYSGSPVFCYLPPNPLPANMTPETREMIRKKEIPPWPGVNEKRMDIPMQLGPWLLGIDYCHLKQNKRILSRRSGRPVSDDWYVASNTGMMGVIPAWRLLDIFEGTEMKPLLDAARKDASAVLKESDGIELDVTRLPPDAPASDENPTHREDFTSLLGKAARTPPQCD